MTASAVVGTKMAPSNIKLNPVGITVIVIGVLLVLYAMGFPGWFRTDRTVNMRELLSASIDVARRGGDIVREIRIAGSKAMQEESKGETLEGAKEMMTQGDLESHKLMFYSLKRAFPGLEVQSEEHDHGDVDVKNLPEVNRHLSEVQTIGGAENIPIEDIAVWIDPLDATQEYTEDLRQYVTTMVCVAVRGVPVLGVIYKPFYDKTYWGYVGYGHSTNLHTPEATAQTAAEQNSLKIIVSRSHSGQVANVTEKALGADKKIEVIPAGGAGYKTLEVISGNASAYVHVTRIKKWDLCAGNAIIKSVDIDNKDGIEGRMTTLEGADVDYSVAGSPINDDGLLATIKDHQWFLGILRPAFEELKHSQGRT